MTFVRKAMSSLVAGNPRNMASRGAEQRLTDTTVPHGVPPAVLVASAEPELDSVEDTATEAGIFR